MSSSFKWFSLTVMTGAVVTLLLLADYGFS
jgi:hypothetical protein